jgi:2-polyprenyl-3-methyl-5-hydroxy-6-metoxy-1,4-benzoquinol methylase
LPVRRAVGGCHQRQIRSMSDVARHYGWTSDKTPPSVRVIMPALTRMLRQRGSRRLVDLGCGNGALTGLLAAEGFDVCGLDADAQAIALARKAHPALRFEQLALGAKAAATVREIVPGADTVIAIEVIEHLFRPADLIVCAGGILPVGGTLILSTPYHGYLKNLAITLMNGWDKHWNPAREGGHIKFWSRPTLTRFLDANGFDIEECVGVGRAPWLWHSMVVAARKR